MSVLTRSATLGILVLGTVGLAACDDPLADRTPRGTFKPRHGKLLERYADLRAENHIVFVKFVEGSNVRLNGGAWMTASNEYADATTRLAGLAGVRRIHRYFEGVSVQQLDARRQHLTKAGHQLADLNLYYRLALETDADPVEVTRILRANPVVEIAWVRLRQAGSSGGGR